MVRGTGAEELSIADNDASAISVAIIDGQDVVHAGIEAWLPSGRPPIKIVGNYLEPAEFIADHPAATDAVEFVLLALQYEGHGPEFRALRRLSQAGHRVIVYSHLVSDEVILSSLDAGAVTYVTKFEGGRHLREAIYAA